MEHKGSQTKIPSSAVCHNLQVLCGLYRSSDVIGQVVAVPIMATWLYIYNIILMCCPDTQPSDIE